MTKFSPPGANGAVRTRQVRMSLTVLVVYAVLVATHRGEFWPFSLFPMFSRAGRGFTRVLVRELAQNEVLAPVTVSAPALLPGRPLALAPLHVDQNDLSRLLFADGDLDARRVNLIEQVFAEQRGRRLILYAALGRLDAGGNLIISYTPRVSLGPQGARQLGVR